MKKYLIVNADDLGLSKGTNLGIEKAHREGILTSASLFASNPGFNHAIKIIKRNPKLGIGAHLSLNLGTPVLKPREVPELVDSAGDFYGSFVNLISKSLSSKNFLLQVERELNAQVEKILDSKIKIDHINGQQHFHTIPGIFPIVKKIATNYNLHFRVPRERYYLTMNLNEDFSPFINTNIIKYLLIRSFLIKERSYSKEIQFFGLLHTNKITKEVFLRLLKLLKPGATEILLHPAFYKTKHSKLFRKQKMLTFMKNKGRKMEVQTLTDPEIKKTIKSLGIILTNFGKI